MKVVITVAILLVAVVMMSALPHQEETDNVMTSALLLQEKTDNAKVSALPLQEETDEHVRAKRGITCSINRALCVAHCKLRKYRTGYCNKRKVCVCRK